MEHCRQPYIASNAQCKKDVFDSLTQLYYEDGFDYEDLPSKLLEYFSDMSLQEATMLRNLWERDCNFRREMFCL
jgi:hypothetical protein